jgi:hypothetical protein
VPLFAAVVKSPTIAKLWRSSSSSRQEYHRSRTEGTVVTGLLK